MSSQIVETGCMVGPPIRQSLNSTRIFDTHVPAEEPVHTLKGGHWVFSEDWTKNTPADRDYR